MIQPIIIYNKKIGQRKIGQGFSPFVVAEAAVNHEGDIKKAEWMVRMAHAVGADCIKFQIHVLENEMLKDGVPMSDNMPEPLWDILKHSDLSVEEHIKLRSLCEELGIWYLCTPFSRDGADILEKEVGVDFFKMGSGELTNLPLVEHVAKKGKPMIVSTGMSNFQEVKETVDLIKSIGTPFILTHCTSAYPCPYEAVNLNVIKRYQTEFNVPIGLSDHSRGIYTSLGAVALGACFIEKHFTYDKMAKGIDHASSIEPYDLGELVKGCRAMYESLGDGHKNTHETEKQILAWARHSVVSERDIEAGEIISPEMVWVKRPGPADGVVPAKDLKKVYGKRVKNRIPKDQQIKWDYLE